MPPRLMASRYPVRGIHSHAGVPILMDSGMRNTRNNEKDSPTFVHVHCAT